MIKDRKPYKNRKSTQSTRNQRPKRNSKPVKENKTEELIRLNKYIAASGICSRRDADDLIKKGLVKVNGTTITEMGFKLSRHENVTLKGKPIIPEKKVYIVLNKPKDTVSTVKDPHANRTVLDLVNHKTGERIYPVGRLDRNTTGVLLLTNDGELTKKLTHPSYNKKKIYHVVLNKAISKGELSRIVSGIELSDGMINADAISYVNDSKKEVGIELHSGKNRIVRRIFEHLGYEIEKLDRVYFAGLTKKNISRGKWRYLTQKEINSLKRGAYE